MGFQACVRQHATLKISKQTDSVVVAYLARTDALLQAQNLCVTVIARGILKHTLRTSHLSSSPVSQGCEAARSMIRVTCSRVTVRAELK